MLSDNLSIMERILNDYRTQLDQMDRIDNLLG
jgi:hypothetical protein